MWDFYLQIICISESQTKVIVGRWSDGGEIV